MKYYKEGNGTLWCNIPSNKAYQWMYYNPYYKQWCQVGYPSGSKVIFKYELVELDESEVFLLNMVGPQNYE